MHGMVCMTAIYGIKNEFFCRQAISSHICKTCVIVGGLTNNENTLYLVAAFCYKQEIDNQNSEWYLLETPLLYIH